MNSMLATKGGIIIGHATHIVDVVIGTELQMGGNPITGSIPSELASLTSVAGKYDNGVLHIPR